MMFGLPDVLTCSRCNRPVVDEAESYETFERMRWSCFHYEFEHQLAGSADDDRNRMQGYVVPRRRVRPPGAARLVRSRLTESRPVGKITSFTIGGISGCSRWVSQA
jgi:hypothetical protein